MMSTMINISPKPPLGPYPQPWLCGQAGSAPTKSRIKMISRIVDIPIRSSTFNLRGFRRLAIAPKWATTDTTLFAGCLDFNFPVVNISIDFHVACRRSNINHSLFPLASRRYHRRDASGQ
jgi:hypothetical protein